MASLNYLMNFNVSRKKNFLVLLILISLFLFCWTSLAETREILIEVEKEFTVFDVDFIRVSCDKAFNSPQEFEGGKIQFGDPCDPANPGKALITFFKDVVDANLNVQDFDVDLKAVITPEIPPEELPDNIGLWWKCVSIPKSGSFNREDTLEVKLENLRGGKHIIRFALFEGSPKSGANILLPLAGAEVKDIIKADMKRADIWAEKVNAKYNMFEKIVKADKWFRRWENGDYTGRPENKEAPYCRRFNQIDPGTEAGGVGTWFGIPVRVAKYSNFIFAYAARKIGFEWEWIENSTIIGQPDDLAARLSLRCGWDIAGGADYESVMKGKVKEIHKGTVEEDNKTKKLWPNNYLATGGLKSPGFLDMEDP